MIHKILVVDDSSIIRRIIKRTMMMILSNIDEIVEASNGVEALEVLDQKKVELILTDINMENMGGIELIGRVKDNDATKDIPIVVISTEGHEKRIAQLLAEGAVGYIKKPFTPEKVRDTINDIFLEDEDD